MMTVELKSFNSGSLYRPVPLRFLLGLGIRLLGGEISVPVT